VIPPKSMRNHVGCSGGSAARGSDPEGSPEVATPTRHAGWASIRTYSCLMVTLSCVLFLTACVDLVAVVPERPSAVPTLARLPSVTPVTPSPIPSPTPIPALTPTPEPLVALVISPANIRGGPGTDFPIVGILDVGASVTLLRRRGDWFAISTTDLSGWIFRELIAIDPATEQLVSIDQP
jgi:hypothetical protein